MLLSRFFSFDELTNTSHDDLLQRNKIEANDFIANLKELAEVLLDHLRDKFGPITISSGFRGSSLNLRVNGSSTSQHCKGQAADCIRPDWDWAMLDTVANWVAKESGLKFGQVIREKRGDAMWIHISTGERCQALDCADGKTYTVRP